MCLAVLALDQHPRFPLVVAANRDEFFDRPAEPLTWWRPGEGWPDILGGRDLSAGGTWMGLTRQGRLGLLTNVRDPKNIDPRAPSRGEIVPLWLRGDQGMDRLWPRLAMAGYNGFNLLAVDFAGDACHWISNAHHEPLRLSRGLHAVSNAQLDTPWPKVVEIKARVRAAAKHAQGTDALAASLFEALADRSVAPDEQLPATGVPLEWERMLSAAFVVSPDGRYGTRCSTVLIAERTRQGLLTQVIERTFDGAGRQLSTQTVLLPDWPPLRG